MLNDAIVTVGEFIDIQAAKDGIQHSEIEQSLKVENGALCKQVVGDLHRGCERHRDLRMRTPGREHAEIPLAVTREGR